MSISINHSTPPLSRFLGGGVVSVVLALVGLALIAAAIAVGGPPDSGVLRIGTSRNLGPSSNGSDPRNGLAPLRNFIRTETGMENEITRLSNWRELADQMAGGKFQVGVFQGAEFAWAQEKHPQLKPLALATNVHPYVVAYLVARRDNKAADFASLKGQSVSIPSEPDLLSLFVQQQSEINGSQPDAFFGKITQPKNSEDALDDVVDGVVASAVVQQTALEAYKRRKPGRFQRLKEVAHSEPVPSPIIAYYEGALDQSTLQRFREGLQNAGRSERGQSQLALFKLTGFEPAPSDFDRVVAETRKNYPQPVGK